MSKKQQTADYEFFMKNLDSFLKDPFKAGKFLVIKAEKVEGVFDTFENAFIDASSKFIPGTYIIQQAIRPESVVNFLARAV